MWISIVPDFFSISQVSCVFVCTRVSECTSICILKVKNTSIITCISILATPDVPFWASVITTSSVTFRAWVRRACQKKWTKLSLLPASMVWFMLEYARISRWSSATYAISCLKKVFDSGFAFSLRVSRASLSQINPHLDFSLWNEDSWFSAQDVFRQLTSICYSRISPTFQLAVCTDFTICCQKVCQWLLIILRSTL